jgi:hypothetical protein
MDQRDNFMQRRVGLVFASLTSGTIRRSGHYLLFALGLCEDGQITICALYFPDCNDYADLLEFLVNAVARFPTYEVEALKVTLEGCACRN